MRSDKVLPFLVARVDEMVAEIWLARLLEKVCSGDESGVGSWPLACWSDVAVVA